MHIILDVCIKPVCVCACQITDLLDVVLDSFIKTSATGGLGSIKAEVMADTAVALASGNVKLVSSKVSGCRRPESREQGKLSIYGKKRTFMFLVYVPLSR